jgi:hypothetical protein
MRRSTGWTEGYTPVARAKKRASDGFPVAIKKVAAGAGITWASRRFDVFSSSNGQLVALRSVGPNPASKFFLADVAAPPHSFLVKSALTSRHIKCRANHADIPCSEDVQQNRLQQELRP